MRKGQYFYKAILKKLKIFMQKNEVAHLLYTVKVPNIRLKEI